MLLHHCPYRVQTKRGRWKYLHITITVANACYQRTLYDRSNCAAADSIQQKLCCSKKLYSVLIFFTRRICINLKIDDAIDLLINYTLLNNLSINITRKKLFSIDLLHSSFDCCLENNIYNCDKTVLDKKNILYVKQKSCTIHNIIHIYFSQSKKLEKNKNMKLLKTELQPTVY